jgi:hypothetical protein
MPKTEELCKQMQLGAESLDVFPHLVVRVFTASLVPSTKENKRPLLES